MRKTIASAAAATMVFCAGAANAADAGATCQGGKLKVSSSYAACRLKVDAAAVVKGTPIDYSKCEDKFNDKFAAAEDKAGGMCQTTGDLADIKGLVEGCGTAIATSLSTGADFIDPVTCNSDLEECLAFLNCGLGGISGTWTLSLPDAYPSADTCSLALNPTSPTALNSTIGSCGYLGGASATGNLSGTTATATQAGSAICSGYDLDATITFTSCNSGSGTYTCKNGGTTVFSGTMTATR